MILSGQVFETLKRCSMSVEQTPLQNDPMGPDSRELKETASRHLEEL
jgi:hypothetical protein